MLTAELTQRLCQYTSLSLHELQIKYCGICGNLSPTHFSSSFVLQKTLHHFFPSVLLQKPYLWKASDDDHVQQRVQELTAD